MSSIQTFKAPIHAINHVSDRPGFRSFKTTSAINYPRRWHRDLLIQATLDPSVMGIEQAPPDLQQPETFGIFVWFGQRRRLVVATRDLPESRYSVSGPDSLTVTRSFVLEEPRCTVAREIWSTRSVQISPGIRIKILHELNGSVDGLPLGRLMESLRDSVADPIDVVLALVCAGQAQIDIGSRLSPETVVKRHSAMQRSIASDEANAAL